MCQPTYAQSNITRGFTIPAIYGAFNAHLPGGLQLPQPRGLQYSQPRCFKFPYPRCFQFPHTKHLQSFDLAPGHFLNVPTRLDICRSLHKTVKHPFHFGCIQRTCNVQVYLSLHRTLYRTNKHKNTNTEQIYADDVNTERSNAANISTEETIAQIIKKNTVYYKYEHRRQTTF